MLTLIPRPSCSAERRSNVEIKEKPQKNTEYASPDEPVNAPVCSFANRNAVAFDSFSDGASESKNS